MDNKTATAIPTDIFNKIVSYLLEEGWRITKEYSPEVFDKGIDFDFYELKKDNEVIQMAWENWLEGELLASLPVLDWLSQKMDYSFQFGASEHFENGKFKQENSPLIIIK